MKKILIPLISTIAAIAVGIASALIAIQLTSTAVPTTVRAPILAPSTIDGVPSPGLEESSGLSRVTGEGTVVDPTAVSAGADPLPDDVAAAVAALDGEDGMDGARAHEIVGGARSGSGSPADDPCAATPPPSGSDCPDGLRSVVFADTLIPDIQMYLVPDPGTDPTGLSVYCTSADDTGAGLLYNIATTIPATISMRVWPTDDPSAGFDVTLESPAAHATQWRRAGGNSTDRYVDTQLFQHCTELTGLRANSLYSVVATATDTYGRVSRLYTGTFDSDGLPTRPDLQVIPLNDNVLYASAPFDSRYSTPLMRAWVVAPGQPADCSDYDGAIAQLHSYRSQTVVPVSAEYLDRNNFDPNFRSRVSNFYSVPEGSTVVVCARTFNALAPSWDAQNPVRQQFVSLETPDQVVPVVTLDSIDFSRDINQQSVAVGVTNSVGLSCSPTGIRAELDLPTAARSAGTHDELNRVICDPRAQSAYSASQGFNNRLVVTTQVETGTGSIRSSFLLNLARYACTGNCALPPTLTFDVPLAREYISRPLLSCSNPFGCDYPPMPDGSSGTAHLTVTWDQGNTNLRTDWVRGEVDSTLPDDVVPDYPQRDERDYIRTGLSVDGFSGFANFGLRVDRGVDYRVTLSGACFQGTPRNVATGHLGSGASQDLYFSGLCPGATYSTTIELVDAEGQRSVYSTERTATDWRGAVGQATVPQNTVDFDVSVELRSTGPHPDQWWTSGADVSIDDVDMHTVTDFPQDCFSNVAGTGGSRVLTGTAPQQRQMHLSVVGGVITEALYYGVNHDADCSWPSASWQFIRIEMDVPYEQLRGGVTYRQTLDGQYTMTVTVRGTTVAAPRS